MAKTKKQRGQFFTTQVKVQRVLGSLIQTRHGLLLEPSAGAGHLVKWAEENLTRHEIHAVELDQTLTPVCSTSITRDDFFQYSVGKEGSYDAILGNPPYVAWKDAEEATKATAATVKAQYSDKANLYHLFIDRCIDLLAPGGELILIVPKEWLYTTSAKPLRDKMLASGHLTHLVDCGEEKLFDDANVPALIIFRYEHNRSAGVTRFAASLSAAQKGNYTERRLAHTNGRLLLLSDETAHLIRGWGRLGESFSVKVGIVTGADSVFRLPDDADIEPEMVLEYTTTRGAERFLDANHVKKWNDMPPKAAAYLLTHKNTLMARRITQFDESNWWKYGAVRNREAMLQNTERFLSLAKTRSATPFFAAAGPRLYSGGILGLFRTPGGVIPSATALTVLNDRRYREILDAMFLTTADKVSLQPATLEDAPFPRTLEQATLWLHRTDF